MQPDTAALTKADTLALDAVTVSAPRSVESLSSAPLQRVSETLLSETGAVSLQEALRTFSGVSVKDYGGIGGLKTVNIRSFGAQHTGVSYDGITQANARNGQVDIGRFNLDNVGSIELDIAGCDDIFRSARLASYVGTLSINSKRPEFPDSCRTHAGVRMRAGSFGTLNPYLQLDQQLSKRWACSVSADYLHSDGDYPFLIQNGQASHEETRLNSDVNALNALFKVYADLAQADELIFSASAYVSERGLPGSVVLYTQDPSERLWDREWSASALYTRHWEEHWALKAGLSYVSEHNRYVNTDPAYPAGIDDRYHQQEGALSVTALWTADEHFQLSLAEDFTLSHLDANLANCLYPTREASYTALSAQYKTPRLTLTGVLLGTLVSEQTRVGEAAGDRHHLSPSLSLSYQLFRRHDLRLRASFKESYRLPTFNDLYYPRIGAKNLEPETARQANMGLTWFRQWDACFLSLSADAYGNLVDNKITAVPTLFVWSMRNIGRVEMTGLDLSAHLNTRLAEGFRLKVSGNYSCQHAVDVTDPEAKNYGDQIAYTPRHTGSASVIVETPWFNVGYTLNAVGERYALSQNTAACRIDPYADHCISVNRGFSFGRQHPWQLHLSAEVLNLADDNYEIIRYYPMPGRHGRVSVRLTY